MNEEACFADEVVVVFVGGEVVDGLLARHRRDRGDRAPIAIHSKEAIADAQVAGVDPLRGLVAVPRPEWMVRARPERQSFAFDAFSFQVSVSDPDISFIGADFSTTPDAYIFPSVNSFDQVVSAPLYSNTLPNFEFQAAVFPLRANETGGPDPGGPSGGFAAGVAEHVVPCKRHQYLHVPSPIPGREDSN